MADYYSVREATAEYRLAISNSHDHLESFLVENRPWAYLERKKVFSLAELEVMKKKPTKTAIKLLLTALLEKGNIDTFISFSKALHTMSFDMGRQIFPFADRAGGIPVRLQQLKAGVRPHHRPVVLWMVSSEGECDMLASVIGPGNWGPVRNIAQYCCKEYVFIYEKPSVDEVTMYIAYPHELESAPTNTMTAPVDLLLEFSPQPHIAVMTGTCCANAGRANLGDLVIPTLKEPTFFFAELQHMVEMWKLGGELSVPKSFNQPRSFFQQMVCLARIYAELHLPEATRSRWFKGLSLDLTRPLKDNRGVRICVTDPDKLWLRKEAKNFWSRVEGDVLPYAPCEMLLKEARASILFASDQFSSISETLQPDELLQVHFGRVDRFKGSEDRIICNPEVVNFYTAASMSEGLLYIAALGVSSIDNQSCREREYDVFGRHYSAYVMWKIVKYVAQYHSCT